MKTKSIYFFAAQYSLAIFALFLSGEVSHAARKKDCTSVVQAGTFEESETEFEASTSRTTGQSYAEFAYDRDIKKEGEISYFVSKEDIAEREVHLLDIEEHIWNELSNSPYLNEITPYWAMLLDKKPKTKAKNHVEEDDNSQSDSETSETSETTEPKKEKSASTPLLGSKEISFDQAVSPLNENESQKVVGKISKILFSEKLVHDDALKIFEIVRGVLLKKIEELNSTSDPLSEEALANITQAKDLIGLIEQHNAETEDYFEFIVRGNLKLVLAAASKYRHFLPSGMSFLDLVQEGNIGIMNAARRFIPRMGFQFSTIAYWWIRHAFTQSRADKGPLIRIPVHMTEVINRFVNAERSFIQRNARKPTPEEMATIMEMTPKKVNDIYDAIKLGAVSSLDEPVSGLGGSDHDNLPTRGESMAKPEEQSVIDKISTAAEKAMMIQALDVLNPKERHVVEQRFGLTSNDYGNERTLEDISQDYDVTRERIRQLEKDAFRKLRAAVNTLRNGHPIRKFVSGKVYKAPRKARKP